MIPQHPTWDKGVWGLERQPHVAAGSAARVRGDALKGACGPFAGHQDAALGCGDVGHSEARGEGGGGERDGRQRAAGAADIDVDGSRRGGQGGRQDKHVGTGAGSRASGAAWRVVRRGGGEPGSILQRWTHSSCPTLPNQDEIPWASRD
jgi:hypothetical protein